MMILVKKVNKTLEWLMLLALDEKKSRMNLLHERKSTVCVFLDKFRNNQSTVFEALLGTFRDFVWYISAFDMSIGPIHYTKHLSDVTNTK